MQHISLENKNILITGAAGFIGSYLVLEILKSVSPVSIIGIDNMNTYYDVSIKEYRLKEIEKEASGHPESSWKFIKADISDKAVIDVLFQIYKTGDCSQFSGTGGRPVQYYESGCVYKL